VHVPGLSRAGATYKAIWPQGWSFFSDVPTSDVVFSYQVDRTTGQLTPLNQKQAGKTNLWGLRRGAYSQLAEIQLLRGGVPTAGWMPCAGASCASLARTEKQTPVRNSARTHSLCGDIALMKRSPQATAGAVTPNSAPAGTQIAALRVDC
jgi:antimicrobial peptide system SdpA family protein